MKYCLPCFGRSKSRDNEREPLLPRHTGGRESNLNAPPDTTGSERSVVDKFVDVLVALENGKVPSQDQLSGFLQNLLRSRLLEEEKSEVVSGSGPTSKQGRKVLGDARAFIQALLQFGMEKNADDKLQETYFQLMQIESPSPVHVDTKSSLYTAGQTALDAAKQAGAELNDEGLTDQLAFDAATFLHALRTLFEMCISSPVFRLLLTDIFAIARAIVAHAAADVERAALHVQQTVAESTNDIIATGESNLDVKVDDVKEKGKEVAGVITNAPQEIWNEWQVLGEDATDKTKERILERIQEVISRLQKDKASRSAMLSIMILTRKYTEKIASASETVSETVGDVLKQTKDSFNDAEASQAPNYPPHPYSSPKHEEKKPFFDVTSDALLTNFRDILQRLAGGYSLDGLLSAFSRVVRDLNDIPLVFGDEVNQAIEEKLKTSETTASQSDPSPVVSSSPQLPPGGGGKAKSKKKRKKQKAKAEKESPLPPSEFQIEGDATPTEETEKGDLNATGTTSNPLRAYFSRLGEYLDKALNEPGWAMSKDAAKTLEVLFDDGVELVNVVDESVIEVGADILDAASTSKGSGEDEVRRIFKNDLISLVDESEAYIAAFEKDKTTMKLLQALDVLGEDLTTLFSLGGRQSQRGITESIKGMGGWTSWLGWTIPRIMRMLPLGAIPIPSIEVKTANFEGALQSLFVQNLVHGETSTASVHPIASSLVPDDVVLREWTELRIDMADYKRPLDGSVGASAPTSHQVNGVHTTSRVHMHVDGIRARVEGLGYYFKYTGAYGFGYEDEGVLSVDVGMGSLHDGFGADVEIEIENDSNRLESASPAFDIPQVIVSAPEGEEELGKRPPHLDVQGAVREAGDHNLNADNISGSVSASGADQPLFRVVDVRITLQGLRFKLDKSRHWILNKLFIQTLAGSIAMRVLRQALEDRVRVSMEVLASGLGEVVRDVRKRGEERKLRNASRPPGQDQDGEEGLKEFITDWWSALIAKLPVILGRGANSEPRELEEGEIEVEVETQTSTSAEATSKGVIFTNTTTTTTTDTKEQQAHSTSAMVFDKPTGSMRTVDLTMEAIGTPLPLPPQQEVEEEEIVVAIGGGAQLFPGKPGPFGESSKDGGAFSAGVVGGMKDGAKRAVNGVVEGVHMGKDVVESVEERLRERGKKERHPGDSRRKRTWISDAFDFL
ncbi:hypothetical protein M413DRAFT_10535 [Hebeloma cylindrosporum]|uniref:HAM1-like N-terminal domain-containing protein n=1 Tax=Hebeloma cylindrosporum TaxID=76867 RepID=A0A0C2YMY3_HEBCY|nr:hypothetical protein M413DRAFT_10535 [Hebeloma cylindrosporum h7]